ncbi:MAG: phospholipid carrier-dependent glycosyltransferase [Kiritimatiellaeota bacterium]|nr:phospholipid carrier-dependent glycosyltransferase [Kiritimatiellota bacterium]
MDEKTEKDILATPRPLSAAKGKHSFLFWVLIIFLIGFALRTGRCFLVNRIVKDGVLYVRMARDYDRAPRSEAFQLNRRMPPLYPQLMSFVSGFGCSYETAGRLISVLAGTLTLIPFLLMARVLFGDRIALVAMSLAAVHPSLVRNSATVMRDPLFLFLFATSAACMIAAANSKKTSSLPLWIASGTAAALSAATRGEGSELLLALFLWLCVSLFRPGGEKKRFAARLGKRAAILAVFTISYVSTTFALLETVKGTDSTWIGVDSRIVSYLKGMITLDSEEVLKEEDTL